MVKTHREKWTAREYGNYSCYFCGNIAAYWTQNEQPDGELQYPVIWTCQSHIDLAKREAIATEPSKRSKILYYDGHGACSLKPVKTNPIKGVYLTTRAGVWYVGFARKDWGVRPRLVVKSLHLHRLNKVLLTYCDPAEISLLANGNVSIWYNIKGK